MINDLYPEITEAGGLANALNNEFEKIKSLLRVEDDLDKLPFTYARVENGKKFSQIYIAADSKLYLSDYWREGVCLANGNTDSLPLLTESLNFWLSFEKNTIELSNKFEFVTPYEKAKAFEQNNEVDYTWNEILNNPNWSELKEFVILAIKDDILSTLFPFISMSRLCFSRCTGYPYTYDTPIVIPISDKQFEIRLSNNDFLGSGTASEALKMVKVNLPIDIKPAIKGTADDL